MKRTLLILGLAVSFFFAGNDGAYGASRITQAPGSEAPVFENSDVGPWGIGCERMTIRGLKPIRR